MQTVQFSLPSLFFFSNTPVGGAAVVTPVGSPSVVPPVGGAAVVKPVGAVAGVTSETK